MSRDKGRSLARRVAMIDGALRSAPDHPRPHVLLNCLGGMSSEDADLRRLVEDGHMSAPAKGTPTKRFERTFRELFRPCGIRGSAPRLRSYVTEAGLAFHAANEGVLLGHRRPDRMTSGRFWHAGGKRSWPTRGRRENG